MLSCQQTQNVIDGKKRIILNPSEGQKKDFETITFADGEVYGIDVLVTSNEDGKVRLITLDHCGLFRLVLHHDAWYRHGRKQRERRYINVITQYRTS